MTRLNMQLALLLLLCGAVAVFCNVNGTVFRQRALCDAKKFFEMTFTVFLPNDNFAASETFVFKTDVRPLGDKTQLLRDIDTMILSRGRVTNAEEISSSVQRSYDAFLANMSGEENCPQAWVADLGFKQHEAERQSLNSLSIAADNNIARHASEILTVVSGYWNVQKHKYMQNTAEEGNPYEKWMQNSLRLRMPYVIFTDRAHVNLIRQCRAELPTLIVLRNQTEFVTHASYDASWTHPVHVPSAALASIWLEKINLLLLASHLTNTTHYAWVDSGLSSYRTTPMPPEEWSLDVILSLPHQRISYARVSASYHSYAGGVAIMRRELIPLLYKLFYEEYNRCIQSTHDWRCGSDQYLLTLIRDRLPHLFHPMSYNYGDISFLWANRYPMLPKKL